VLPSHQQKSITCKQQPLTSVYIRAFAMSAMASAIEYCFWIEGTFTFLVYVWGVHHFWQHPKEPVWGAIAGSSGSFLLWLWCELGSWVCFGLLTSELWDNPLVDWSVVLTYSVFLLGEGLWMLLTVYKQVQLNRICLYVVSAAIALLAMQVCAARLSSVAVVPAFLLALHTIVWNAVIWLNSWEAEVKAQVTEGYPPVEPD